MKAADFVDWALAPRQMRSLGEPITPTDSR